MRRIIKVNSNEMKPEIFGTEFSFYMVMYAIRLNTHDKRNKNNVKTKNCYSLVNNIKQITTAEEKRKEKTKATNNILSSFARSQQGACFSGASHLATDSRPHTVKRKCNRNLFRACERIWFKLKWSSSVRVRSHYNDIIMFVARNLKPHLITLPKIR